MKKYTRKHICEALSYWRKQLKALNESEQKSAPPQDITFKFDTTPDLGGVVSSITPFNMLDRNSKVSINLVLGDFNRADKYPGLVGNKWSCLCGFNLVSNVVKAPKDKFQIVFVPKINGMVRKMMRPGVKLEKFKNPSGWYIWQHTSDTHKTVTSIQDLKKLYKFDANKFFHSDYFNREVTKFKSDIEYAIDHQLADLVKQMENIPVEDRAFNYGAEFSALKSFIGAIKLSLQNMLDVKDYVVDDWYTSDYGYNYNDRYDAEKDDAGANAKIAYNANLTYDLKDNNNDLHNALNAEAKYLYDQLMKHRKQNAKAPAPAEDDADKTTKSTEPKNSKVKYDSSLEDKTDYDSGHDDDFGLDKYDDIDDDDFRK